MIVVLDTNIWVSAIIWGGFPDENYFSTRAGTNRNSFFTKIVK